MARIKVPSTKLVAGKSPRNIWAMKLAYRQKQMPPKEKQPPPKRPHRYRPGTVALREIRRYQKTTELLLPHRAFQRIVREIVREEFNGFRLQIPAVRALQEAAEAHVVSTFEMGNLCAIHANRVTIMPRDICYVYFAPHTLMKNCDKG